MHPSYKHYTVFGNSKYIVNKSYKLLIYCYILANNGSSSLSTNPNPNMAGSGIASNRSSSVQYSMFYWLFIKVFDYIRWYRVSHGKMTNVRSPMAMDFVDLFNSFRTSECSSDSTIFAPNALNLPWDKVEKVLEDSLDWIPSPSAKIQIIGGKVYLR